MAGANLIVLAHTLKVAACQTPEIRENLEQALQWLEQQTASAVAEDISLLCFPECFLQGYLLDPEKARRHALDFQSPAFSAILKRLACLQPTLIVGLIEQSGNLLYNTAAVIQGGRLLGSYRKRHLHAKEALFSPGQDSPIFDINGLKIGLNICYDTNFPQAAAVLAAQGAKAIVCLANNMLPLAIAENWKNRHLQIRAQRAQETGLWLISSDVVGQRDDCIAFGTTSILRPDGQIATQLPSEQTGIVSMEIPVQRNTRRSHG